MTLHYAQCEAKMTLDALIQKCIKLSRFSIFSGIHVSSLSLLPEFSLN